MAHYNFEKDLTDGRQAEEEVIERLSAHLNISPDEIERSSSRGWDFKIRSKGWTFEVKNDLLAERTGNVAIEYECRGRPSGLAATEAEFWVCKFSNTFLAVSTIRLRHLLFEKKRYLRAVTGGDPGSQTKMFLVKIADFKTWGKEI